MVALLSLLLAQRIAKGVDLSDEAYYAIFLDDWLKGGIQSSTFLSLHQTAALIVYPAALIYTALKGSSDGLILFLRSVYLAGAIASALVWTIFIRQLGHGLLAWIGGVLILAFVPFSLPAPSYNTLGQQGLTLALSAFGCAVLVKSSAWTKASWFGVSAFGWAAAVVAYPSFLLPLGVICGVGLLNRRGNSQQFLYIALVAAAVAMAWSCVLISLSWTRLHDSFEYLSAVNDVGGWHRKTAFIVNLIRSNAAFALLCTIGILVGLLRNLAPMIASYATTACIGLLFFLDPTLFARSHDVILLSALTGLGLLSGFKGSASTTERTIAIVYATSLIAALTTMATAFNSIWNFPIGGLPAAGLALIGRPAFEGAKPVSFFPAIAAIGAILSTSLFFFYGEIPGLNLPRQLITKGTFSGIAALPSEAETIRIVQNEISPTIEKNQTLAVLGRSPGIVLETRGRLSMLMALTVTLPNMENGREFTDRFFEDEKNRPLYVIIHRTDSYEPANPFHQRFFQWYVLAKIYQTPSGELAVYRRR